MDLTGGQVAALRKIFSADNIYCRLYAYTGIITFKLELFKKYLHLIKICYKTFIQNYVQQHIYKYISIKNIRKYMKNTVTSNANKSRQIFILYKKINN